MKYLRFYGTVAITWLLAHLLALPAGAEQSPWPTIFRGSAEVNVINIEVVVTDADGRPVSGLGRDDFELLENGDPVEISNFYAVAAGSILPPAEEGEPQASAPPEPEPAPAAEQRQLQLILYVDNANLGAINRRRLFSHLREFLAANWRPDMRVMLATNDRALVLRQDFTTVPEEIFAALDEVEAAVPITPRFDIDRRQIIRAMEEVNVDAGSDVFDLKDPTGGGVQGTQAVGMARLILNQIRVYSDQYLNHVRESLRILDELIETAAALYGPKTVIYISDGLPLQPGAALLEAYSRRFSAMSDIGSAISGLDALRDDASREYHELVTRANTNGITFITLDASPSEALERGSAASKGSSGGTFASWNDGIAADEDRNRQESLMIMAEESGGRSGLSISAVGKALQGILSDFDNHYSLGYVAEGPGAAKPREIAVKVRRPGLEVRHRQRFRDKTAAERAAEQTQAALWIDALPNPLEVTPQTGAIEPREDGLFIVPLLVKVPLGKLILVPGPTEHRGEVSMFVAVRDAKGRSSGVNRHLCPIRVANAEVLTAMGRTAACGVHLLVRRGFQRVAVSVFDEVATVVSTTSLELDAGAPEQLDLLPPSSGGQD